MRWRIAAATALRRFRLGEVVPEGLQCGYHGMVFGGDGKCVSIPGQDSVPPQAKVRSYPLVERQEFIWVWMGDPALADESKILDYPWHDDHENWPHKHGMYHIKCNYMLLIDNLMDLTHIPFIHRNTIGGGNRMGQVNARMDVNKHRYRCALHPLDARHHTTANLRAGGRLRRGRQGRSLARTSNMWPRPASCSGRARCRKGAARRPNRDQPGGFSLRLYHGATPETENSCFYFWTPANGYRQDEPEATEGLYQEIADTFLEDLDFLEAQQAALEADPRTPAGRYQVRQGPPRRAPRLRPYGQSRAHRRSRRSSGQAGRALRFRNTAPITLGSLAAANGTVPIDDKRAVRTGMLGHDDGTRRRLSSQYDRRGLLRLPGDAAASSTTAAQLQAWLDVEAALARGPGLARPDPGGGRRETHHRLRPHRRLRCGGDRGFDQVATAHPLVPLIRALAERCGTPAGGSRPSGARPPRTSWTPASSCRLDPGWRS